MFLFLAQVERRLERRLRYGALAAGCEAHYVYDYFHQAGGLTVALLLYVQARQRGSSKTLAIIYPCGDRRRVANRTLCALLRSQGRYRYLLSGAEAARRCKPLASCR